MSQIWNLFHKAQETDQFANIAADDDESLSNSSVRTLNGDQDVEAGMDTDEKQLTQKIEDLKITKKKENTVDLTLDRNLIAKVGDEEMEEEDHDITVKNTRYNKGDKDQAEDISTKNYGETSNPFTLNHNSQQSTINNKPLLPISISSSSSRIFERSVQDQGTLSSISRRNSVLNSPQLSHHHCSSFNSPTIPNFDIPQQLQRTQSSSSAKLHSHHQNHHRGSICPNCLTSNSFPDHLNSEAYIPCVLDASTEVLHDKNTNLENLEVIKPVNSSFFQNYLDPKNKPRYFILSHHHHPPSSSSTGETASISPSNYYNSLPSSRRESSISPINEDIDYSNHLNKNQLNFCSFNDIVNDEMEQQQVENSPVVFDGDEEEEQHHYISPLKRRSSSILIIPALGHRTSSGNIRPLSSTTAAAEF